MATSSKGLRAGTRRKLRRRFREKFKITPYLRKFKKDEKVIVKIDPSSHKGMPHHRFKGKTGIIKEQRGSSFVVEVKDGNKKKTLIAKPEHLNPLNK